MDTHGGLLYSLLCILPQERVGKLRHNESRLEDDKKNLRIALEDAENRCTKLELARRSAEGELQRFKLAMNDKDTENQVSDKSKLWPFGFNFDCTWRNSGFEPHRNHCVVSLSKTH